MNGRSLLIFTSLMIHTIIIGCVSSSTQQPSHSHNSKESAIVGTTMTARDEQGRSLTLQITAETKDLHDPDIYRYTVLSHNSQTGAWENLCPRDRNGVAQAIALAGHWDNTGAHTESNQLTFACTNSVLAKCVQLGYKPWKTVNGQSLRPYHQACTRMLRADYCGNGIAHTREGTPIDVYDRLQIQQSTVNSEMTFEAAWNPEGAVALNRTRYPQTRQQLQQECPEKLQTISKQPDPLSSNGLLFNDSIARHQCPQRRRQHVHRLCCQ